MRTVFFSNVIVFACAVDAGQRPRNVFCRYRVTMPPCLLPTGSPLGSIVLFSLSEKGSVSLDDFWRCIGYVLQLGGTEEGGADWDEASLLTERIHRAFEDRDDMADFAAITSGISILCSSSVEEKVGCTFLDTQIYQVLCIGQVLGCN